jgi:hypothetical protein
MREPPAMRSNAPSALSLASMPTPAVVERSSSWACPLV